MHVIKKEKRQKTCRFFHRKKEKPIRGGLFRLHPCFLLVGAWYCIKGELFLFLTSCLVAVQHECAHAFAAAKLGYKLNKIVLMPFGAMIDGDLRGISFKDEITIALCGPLCNLFTAAFFASIWWFSPNTYAFTDVACYTSLAIALINFLPAYPLDGGRILRCALYLLFLKRHVQSTIAERKSKRICTLLSLFVASVAFLVFLIGVFQKNLNLSLLPFAAFLFIGAIGNKNEPAAYEKIDFSYTSALKKGVELRYVAIFARCPIKDALRYVSQGSYLVLEIYDDNARKLFSLPQNELAEYFNRAPTPYTPIGDLYEQKSE